MQESIIFHYFRVKSPNKNDQKKLGRTIRYVYETKHLPLVLTMNGSGIFEWWVDTVFAAHTDMKSRTDSVMSLVKGTMYSISRKQK